MARTRLANLAILLHERAPLPVSGVILTLALCVCVMCPFPDKCQAAARSARANARKKLTGGGALGSRGWSSTI